MEYRQKNGAFKSVEELKNGKGIGDAVLNKLKAEATVSSAAPKAAQPAVKKISLTSACMPPCGSNRLPVGPGRLCLGRNKLNQWGFR